MFPTEIENGDWYKASSIMTSKPTNWYEVDSYSSTLGYGKNLDVNTQR